MGSSEKRGRSRFSSSIDAAGSVAVRVRERKRGLSRIRVVTRLGRRIEGEEDRRADDEYWAAHWTMRRDLSTRACMLCFRKAENVRVCSSESVGGGGVKGGDCCVSNDGGELRRCGLLLLLTKASEDASKAKPRFSSAWVTWPFDRRGTRM